MSINMLNFTIRQMVLNYIAAHGTTLTVNVIDYVVYHIKDKRATRQRVSGNISSLCCVYNQLTCAFSSLS